jgi:predicted amidohydrolase
LVFPVAAAQMTPRRTIAEAAKAVSRMVARASVAGARYLVTPEMILTGYHAGFSQAERDRVMAGVLRPACRRHRVTLCVGAGNYRDGSGRMMRRPFIQDTVIGPDGKMLGVHSKTIPTDGDLTWCRRGAGLRVFRSGGLTFGVTICNDFWATPVFTSLHDIDVPSRLARLGAKVIFHSIASGSDPRYLDFHSRRMEERAIRAGVWVVSANCAGDGKPVNAPTGIVDSRGRWRATAPRRGERLLVGKIRC